MRRLRAPLTACVAGSTLATLASAHATGQPHEELTGWTLDPWIVAPLLVALAMFLGGWVRLRARSRQGIELLDRRAWLFGVGWSILALALISPLHEAGERAFSAHMLEHELIMLAAAPLLVLAEPLAMLIWAFPPAGRQAIGRLAKHPAVTGSWRFLTAAVTATALQATALWLWHAPALFDRALASDGWHAAQHVSFLASALLFWTAMVSRATAPGIAALCLVATSIVSGALGALMAFATTPWYAAYARMNLAPFGASPAEDQQLAGLLMWVPGGLVHAAVALAIVRRLLRPAHD